MNYVVLELTHPRHADFTDKVIHFTGRTGRPNDVVPVAIRAQSSLDRLIAILQEREIRAFAPFGHYDASVCLTECSPAGASSLVYWGRYEPWGIGFAKQFVFAAGGGPALYIRGDEWPAVAALPPSLRARAQRFWPGATSTDGTVLPSYLRSQSMWAHEREWRVPKLEGAPGFTFEYSDIAFLLVGNQATADAMGESKTLSSIPTVVMDADSGNLQDAAHVWTTDESG
jgi:hypothetical protein